MLTTPLGLALARDVYAHQDPSGLLRLHGTARDVVLGALVGGFVEQAYPQITSQQVRHRERSLYWLGWIARHLGAQRDLRWWNIALWLPPWQLHLLVGAATGCSLGLAAGVFVGLGLGAGSNRGLITGVLVALVTGVCFEPYISIVIDRTPELRGWNPSPQRLALSGWRTVRDHPPVRVPMKAWLLLSSGEGLLVGVPVSIVAVPPWLALPISLAFGTALGLVSYTMQIWLIPAAGSASLTPRSSRRAERSAGVFLGIVGGLSMGGLTAITSTLFTDARTGLLTGLIVGLIMAIVSGAGHGIALLTAEIVLSIQHRGPVAFFPLLQDALDRQILRQAGVVYQFRHSALQDHLANRPLQR